MAVRDARLFRILFEPHGAIARFYDNPNLNFVVIGNYFIAKRPVLRLVRFLLPVYRAYVDDNQLVDVLFKQIDPQDINKVRDFNIRRLLSDQTEPILSDKAHGELDAINSQQTPEQKVQAQNIWVNRFVSEVEKPRGAEPTSVTIEEPQVYIAESPQPVVTQPQTQPVIPPTPPSETPSEPSPQPQPPASGGRGGGFGIPNIPGFGNLLGKGGAGKLATGTAAKVIAIANWPLIIGGTLGGLAIFILLMALLQTTSICTPFSKGCGSTGIAQAAPIGGTIGGSGCPDTSINKDGFQCKYLNPSIGLFDTNISKASIEQYISKYSPTFIKAGKGDVEEFRRRTNFIVDQSKEAGLNPAIFLGYWRTESLFGTVSTRELGCAGDNFTEEVHCALGIKEFSNPQKNPIANCARSKDANSLACRTLRGIRTELDKTHPIVYPIDTFDEFAEAHGPYDHLTNGLPTNCTHTYNLLLETAKELNMCNPTPDKPFNKIADASCPIPNGKIGCASYGPKEGWPGFTGACSVDSTGNGGHCNLNYISQVKICTEPIKSGNLIRTAKSIDVANNSKAGDPAYLPGINGRPTKWRYEGVLSAGGSFGWIRLFKSVDSLDGVWSLHFVHVDRDTPKITIGDVIESGNPGATLYPLDWVHAHVTIGLNVGDSLNDLKDYSPNWKFPDRELGMCTK